jgi:hypothetical protein
MAETMETLIQRMMAADQSAESAVATTLSEDRD